MVTQQELNHYREKTVVLQMIFLEVFVDSELRSIVIFSVFVYFSQEIRDPVSPDQNMDSNHWFQAVNLDQDRMRREEEVGAGLNREKMRLVFRSCFSSGRGNQWFHLLSLQPQPSLISTNIQGKNYSNL